MSQKTLEPQTLDGGTGGGTGTGRWMVVIFNNETNSFDEVIEVLIEATGCGLEEAEIEAWEAHTYGRAPVHFASKEECDDIATKISKIGVKTEVSQEWPE